MAIERTNKDGYIWSYDKSADVLLVAMESASADLGNGNSILGHWVGEVVEGFENIFMLFRDCETGRRRGLEILNARAIGLENLYREVSDYLSSAVGLSRKRVNDLGWVKMLLALRPAWWEFFGE